MSGEESDDPWEQFEERPHDVLIGDVYTTYREQGNSFTNTAEKLLELSGGKLLALLADYETIRGTQSGIALSNVGNQWLLPGVVFRQSYTSMMEPDKVFWAEVESGDEQTEKQPASLKVRCKFARTVRGNNENRVMVTDKLAEELKLGPSSLVRIKAIFQDISNLRFEDL